MVSIRFNGSLAALILLVLTALSSYADVDTRQQIFDGRFRTLKVANVSVFDAAPVIRMGSSDRIEILFDEIGEDNSYLEYRLIHCNADWQPSALIESEYIDGFNAVRIEDYAFSSATYVHYVNYRIELPNEDMPVIRSGNYLLQVYDPDHPDDILLQARFRVSENSAAIAGGYNARTDRGYNDRWQQLEVAATVDREDGGNPYTDYRLEILQNNRQLTDRIITTPARVNGNQLIYDHLQQLIFPASNEYRRFESVSNQFPGMNVDSLRYMGTNYHVWLKPDEPRAWSEYVYDSTQHGRFMVREWNATDSNIGADYITVHFLLDSQYIDGAEIYVDGEMTNGMFTDANRMTWTPQAGVYTLQMPLKQGAYNYQYLLRMPDGTFQPLDGDKWQTCNQYDILLWERKPGERADRLIGYEVFENI